MATLVIANSQRTLKCVVFSPDCVPRAVAKVNTDGSTEQCLVDGDIIFYKNSGDDTVHISFHNATTWQADDSTVIDNLFTKCLTDDVNTYLHNDGVKLPVGLGWDGTNTINDLVFEYGLDRFLTGFPDHAILGGLLGLTTNYDVPSVGTFDVDALFELCGVNINDRGHKWKLDKLFETVDPDYYASLQDGGIAVPADCFNWRAARQLPKVMSVSCIIKDGKPVRYNDLLVWREGYDDPEIVSVVDLVKSFPMKDTNFLSLPYVIDRHVTRVMYVLHQDNLTPEHNSVLWLYRKR